MTARSPGTTGSPPPPDHGVTTVVMGNCGVGFAPVPARDQRDMLIQLMEGVEDIPEVVHGGGHPLELGELSRLSRCAGATAFRYRHRGAAAARPLRVYVMGARGADLEPPTPPIWRRCAGC